MSKYTDSTIDFYQRKFDDLNKMITPLRLERDIFAEALNSARHDHIKNLCRQFEWVVDRTEIEVRYTTGVVKKIFAGVDKFGNIWLKDILKSGKPSKCEWASKVELQYVNHPEIKEIK